MLKAKMHDFIHFSKKTTRLFSADELSTASWLLLIIEDIIFCIIVMSFVYSLMQLSYVLYIVCQNIWIALLLNSMLA